MSLRMNRKHLLIIAKILVSTALITWILRRADTETIWQTVQSANPVLLGFAFFMFYVGYVFTAFRWHLLLKAQNIPATVPFLMVSFTISVFFNNLMPSTIGGDAYRMYDVWRLGGDKSKAFSIILIDRFIGAFALISYAFVAALVAVEIQNSIPGIALYLAMMLLFMLGIMWMVFGSGGVWLERFFGIQNRWLSWPQRFLKKLVDGFILFRDRGDVLLKAVGLSFLLQLNVILHFILVTRALGLDVPWGAMFIIIPLAALVMLIPVSINGIGVRETVFVFFFALYGVSTEEAVAFAWVALAMLLMQGVVGGLVFMFRRSSPQKPS